MWLDLTNNAIFNQDVHRLPIKQCVADNQRLIFNFQLPIFLLYQYHQVVLLSFDHTATDVECLFVPVGEHQTQHTAPQR